MRKGDIVVNPWVSVYFNGELNPNYATIYLGDNKTLDYKGRVCEWADKIYKDNPKRNTPWKVIGHIDLYGITEIAIRDAVFAEEVADTPQTDDDYFLSLMDAVTHGEMSDASANQAYIDYINKQVEESDTPQTDAEISKNALRSACTGCRFVGTYDTEFPCANCTRKNKDYYDADTPQTDRHRK